MNRIESLLQSYKEYISIPWREETAPAQRVVFCVYEPNDERALRLLIDEFKMATISFKHKWEIFDLTDTFATWLLSQRYAQSYFKKPDLLQTLFPKYLDFLEQSFSTFIQEKEIGNNTVVAITGVGSLFGFLRVKELVDKLSPLVKGRLTLFFPGSREDNNYRLLNAYDGWNYLAVPITADLGLRTL